MKLKNYVSYGLQEYFAYKFDSFVSVFNTLLFFSIQYYIWVGIFKSTDGDFFGVSQESYIIYLVMGIMISQANNHSVDRWISSSIKRGEVVFLLLKPLSLFKYYFSMSLGRQMALFITLVPLFLFVSYFFSISHSVYFTYKYFVSFILSILINFNILFLFGVLAFFTTNTWGLYLFRLNILPLVSGQLIALNVLQEMATQYTGFMGVLTNTLYNLSYMLPFQAIYFTPNAIASNMIDGQSVKNHLLLQVIWLIITSLLVAKSQKIAIRRYDVLGG
ncbi:ABC transporter permease [Vibrio splendidus]